MRVSGFRSLRLLTLATTLIAACGCDQVKMFRNRDLAFSYQDDSEGLVDRVSVDSDTRVIASAKRVAIRSTSDPAVTEIEVAEPHFVRGALEVVYTGNLVSNADPARSGVSGFARFAPLEPARGMCSANGR